MSEPQAALALLRDRGAWQFDPARFHALEALARRLPAQPEPVRRVLQDRLLAAVAEYAERFAQAQPAVEARPIAVKPAAAVCAPLAQLNRYIRTVSGAGVAPTVLGEPPEPDELASARRFRRAWSASRSQQQVEQAAARLPANAGPLNSHALVLQSLALVRALSPDYLRRLLLQVESLQWLERAREQYPLPSSKHAKPAKPAKTAKPGGRRKK